MVRKTQSKAGPTRGRAKVSKLTLSKQTVKDLTPSEVKRVRGGRARQVTDTCPSVAICPTLEDTCERVKKL